MNESKPILGLESAIHSDAARLEALGASGGSLDRLYLDEIRASAALAGASLEPGEVEALVTRGVALGGRPLEAYVAVADYADAVRYLRAAPLPSRRSPYLRLEEIVELHARATRRAAGAHPGTWRATTLERLAGDVVPPPPWFVPREIDAFVARFGPGPQAGASHLLWLAEAHERLRRIHPFAEANGRTVRLVTNLLLRRLALPPFVVRERDAERYRAALRRADSRDPWPLAGVIGRSILAGLAQLLAALESGGDLRAVAAFAAGAERDALYKAAQRGRLRAVRRNGALLTTQAWIDAYRSSRRVR